MIKHTKYQIKFILAYIGKLNSQNNFKNSPHLKVVVAFNTVNVQVDFNGAAIFGVYEPVAVEVVVVFAWVVGGGDSAAVMEMVTTAGGVQVDASSLNVQFSDDCSKIFK